MQKNYHLESCQKLINYYLDELEGEMIQIHEGCVGLGKLILFNGKIKNKRAKIVIINEYFITSWTSGHSVIKYNKTPKKYQTIINNQ